MSSNDKMGPLGMAVALEQSEAALRDLAPILGTFFKKLLDQKFTRAEALQIVLTTIRGLMPMSGR